MEMEMRAGEDIEIGEDITPPLTPLSFALQDSFLSSHCSSCFSLLPTNPFPPNFTPTFPNNPHHVLPSSPSYCSPLCSSSDTPIHVSSAEAHLLRLLKFRPSTYSHGDSSDLRAALRLLHFLPAAPPTPRIAGLLTNHHKLLHHHNHRDRVRDGARAMFLARKMRDEARDFVFDTVAPDDAVLEESVLCLVLTNAVEVQDKTGRTLGISVFGPSFCWINHSCSPNACYRFLLSSLPAQTTPLRIVPFRQGTQIESGVCSNNVLTKESGRTCGPRVIVRSIKRIKKGEEVTVTYTDLLQPKVMRQTELWSRYQFVCSCTRCSALPQAYVDRSLEAPYSPGHFQPCPNFIIVFDNHCEEISAANFNSSSLSSDINFDRDEASQMLTEYVDGAIDDYLSIGEPESSCERLEHVLAQGLSDKQSECKEGKSQLTYSLHPLHHLSLNAYTALASAYKIRATELLASYSETNEHLLKGFDLTRTSAAYSLLLAGATHHLFHSESSLIVSVANFWTSAGESLLTLARSSLWSACLQQDLPISNTGSKYRCPNCSLMDKLETYSFHGQVRHADFDYVSSEFIACVTNFTQNTWKFFGLGSQYLRVVKDPIDFSWLGTTDYYRVGEVPVCSRGAKVGSNCESEKSISGSEAGEYTNQVKIRIFKLGVHCLLYGGYLTSICYGNSDLTRYVHNILDFEENISSPC